MKKTLEFSLFQFTSIILGVALLTIFLTNRSGGPKFNLAALKPGYGAFSAAELKKQLPQKDFFLVNVHTPYEGEIIKTDAFIAYNEIDKNLNKLPQDKSAKIVLYCKTGKMSEEALKRMQQLGYTNVTHLAGGMDSWQKIGGQVLNLEKIRQAVLPEAGFSLPLKWGDLGPRLVSLGVIDLEKFKQTVQPTKEQLAILTQESSEPIAINSQNSQFVVDILWAAGLAQKSKVYTDGPMGREHQKEVGNFASTGGWTLARGGATQYLSQFDLFKLSPEQQDKVYALSQNIYRPCCGNPTSFPDCNHGMAALALIELMVSQGFGEAEIYKAVLAFNSFWFPQNYLALAAYYANQGITWDKVDAKAALGQEFSSAIGAGKIAKEVGPLPYLFGSQKGGGCGA